MYSEYFSIHQKDCPNTSESTIMPNPVVTGGEFTVKIDYKEPTSISIYNSGGIQVFNQNTQTNQTEFHHRLEQPGVYFIHIESKTKSEKLKLLVASK